MGFNCPPTFLLLLTLAWAGEPPPRYWAFYPVHRYAVPEEGIDPALSRTPVDAFILEKLNGAGLKPAPPAEKLALIRRATFDLTGLPPTPEEIDAFLKDESPDAFDKVIERLSASPRYGERWGRHWLDVARYADTDGYSNDYERPNAWRYRDYVIHSFNTDKPYDQFILEQLAGDELDPNNPECLVATGFLRMGPWEKTSMTVEAVVRQQFLDDVTQSLAVTFLGISARCARCHDHKFDPIPTRDYYRLQAVFAPLQFEQRTAPFRAWENRNAFEEAVARVKEKIESNQQRRQQLEEEVRQRLLKEHNVSDIQQLPKKVVRDEIQDAAGELVRAYRKRIEYYERELQRYQPLAYSVSTGGLEKQAPTPETHILIGGSLESPGEKVTPGVFRAVYGSDDSSEPSAWNTIPEAGAGRRLALARWIASPSNTLTARVMVNRIWQYHFGWGLVRSSNNFGSMGDRPSHPELLDWLAQYFVEHGWSVKEMHRLVMKSAVYQRSSDPAEIETVKRADPQNQLLSYFPSRRLAYEELRDAVLSVSGQLHLEAGGPGVFPEMNPELALQPRQIMGTIAPAYQSSPSRAERNRRTIYTFQQRNLIRPMQEVFNGANSNESCERREATTVTPQVFQLFNSQFVHDMALAMAEDLGKESPDPAEQIDRAFRRTFGRLPTEKERTGCLEHLQKMREHHSKTSPAQPSVQNRIVRSIIGELTGKQYDFEEDWDLEGYEFNLNPHEVAADTRALAEVCLVLLNSNEFIYVH